MVQILKHILQRLDKIGLADYMEEAVSSTSLGEMVSRNCVSIDTIEHISKNNGKTSFKEMLELLSQIKENERFRSKSEDRKILTLINNNTAIRYPIKGAVNSYEKKCFLLYQVAMSCTEFNHKLLGVAIESWMMKKEQMELLSHSWRALSCINEYFVQRKNVEGIINSIKLRKALAQSLWPDSTFVLYQIPKIGEKLTKELAKVSLL
jgi:hypothetical protein